MRLCASSACAAWLCLLMGMKQNVLLCPCFLPLPACRYGLSTELSACTWGALSIASTTVSFCLLAVFSIPNILWPWPCTMGLLEPGMKIDHRKTVLDVAGATGPSTLCLSCLAQEHASQPADDDTTHIHMCWPGLSCNLHASPSSLLQCGRLLAQVTDYIPLPCPTVVPGDCDATYNNIMATV
jgi:hypothetical protein